MKINELWNIGYGKLSEMRIKALVKLSRTDISQEERQILRRICEIWKIRTDNEIN